MGQRPHGMYSASPHEPNRLKTTHETMKSEQMRFQLLNRPFRTWQLLVPAFGILLALMLVSGLATLSRTTQLYDTLSDLNRMYRQDWRGLDNVRSGIHVSSVLVRDYLLDPSLSRAKEIREELLKERTATEESLRQIERALEREHLDKLVQLRTEINAYWESLDPVFDWSPEEKQAAAYGFLRHRIMPRRDAVLSLAEEIQHFTDTTFQRERDEIRANEER